MSEVSGKLACPAERVQKYLSANFIVPHPHNNPIGFFLLLQNVLNQGQGVYYFSILVLNCSSQ